MKKLFLVWMGKSLALIAKLKGGGSSLPGLVVERADVDFIKNLRDHFGTVILVVGTNGKTTTTKMLHEILQCKGISVTTNQAGSNMSRGVISSILVDMDWRGELRNQVGLFEVDEGFLPMVAKAFKPDILVALNLHRDQLDRYGELERITGFMATGAANAKCLVVNADDPRLANLSGVSKTIRVSAANAVRQLVPNDDTLHNTDNISEITNEAKVSVYIKSILVTNDGQEIELLIDKTSHKMILGLKGAFNAYNAAMAVASALEAGVDINSALKAISQVKPAFGRGETIDIDGKLLKILLVKNPSGFNQTISGYLNESSAPTLVAINDNYADGRDVSWLWDVMIEDWSRSDYIICSGSRGYDMALRLAYADKPSDTELDLSVALNRLLEQIKVGNTGYVVATYTAMLLVRKILAKSSNIEAWG